MANTGLHDAYFSRAMRSCDECMFFSDQQAKIDRKKNVVAKCLNPASTHHGSWRKEDAACRQFVKGNSIDLPKEDAA